MNTRLVGLVLAGVCAFGTAGCQKGDIAKLKEENQKLNTLMLTYERENKDLMAKLDSERVKNAQLESQLAAKAREAEMLYEKLRNKPRGVFTNDTLRQLQEIAREIGGTVEGNRISMPGDFLFDSGSWALKPNAKAAIQKISAVLNPQANHFGLMIVGHTDTDPPKAILSKGIKTNRHLSLMRSLEVLNYMSSSCGYPSDLMYPTGWGELKPVADNSSRGSKSRNRRVEIYVDPDLSGLMNQTVITDVSPAGGPAPAPVGNAGGDYDSTAAESDTGAPAPVLEK